MEVMLGFRGIAGTLLNERILTNRSLVGRFFFEMPEAESATVSPISILSAVVLPIDRPSELVADVVKETCQLLREVHPPAK